jgi:hypothetical protein
MDAAKPAAAGSNGIQAATVALSRCAAACIETESKPTCRQPGTIPKGAESRNRAGLKVPLWKVRDCKIAAENQSDAVVPNCRFLNPTMAGHSSVLTLQFLDVLFS